MTLGLKHRIKADNGNFDGDEIAQPRDLHHELCEEVLGCLKREYCQSLTTSLLPTTSIDNITTDYLCYK